MFDLVEGESKNYILETAGEQKGISEGMISFYKVYFETGQNSYNFCPNGFIRMFTKEQNRKFQEK